jgi:hypothetical protein
MGYFGNVLDLGLELLLQAALALGGQNVNAADDI